jgi:hypothetical protein
MRLTEDHLRLGVGIGLWSLSGTIMAFLFLSLAGSEPLLQALGVGWSVLLTAAMILLWRAGGRRRAITLLLELITVCAAAGMAWNRIEASKEQAASKALDAIRQSAEYRAATAAYDQAEVLVSTLTARLQALPFDWATAAGKITAELGQAQERAQSTASEVARLEAGARLGGDGHGIPGLVGQGIADMLEFGLVILLAVLTEASALALVGAADQLRTGSSNSSRTAPGDASEVTADRYLAAARTLGDGQRLAGYRSVAAHLNIGERKARELVRQLVLEGRVKGRTRTGGSQ